MLIIFLVVVFILYALSCVTSIVQSVGSVVTDTIDYTQSAKANTMLSYTCPRCNFVTTMSHDNTVAVY
jgi:hypothetical protein